MILGGDPGRHLAVVRAVPGSSCPHREVRHLTWVCVLPPHGADQAHVLRTRRG